MEPLVKEQKHHVAFIMGLVEEGLIPSPVLAINSCSWQGATFWNVNCEINLKVKKPQSVSIQSSGWDQSLAKQREKVISQLSARLCNLWPHLYQRFKSAWRVDGEPHLTTISFVPLSLPPPPPPPPPTAAPATLTAFKLPVKAMQSLQQWMQEERNLGRFRQMCHEMNRPPPLKEFPPVKAGLLEDMSARLLAELEGRLAQEEVTGMGAMADREFFSRLEPAILDSVSGHQVTVLSGVYRSHLLLPYLPHSLLDSMTMQSMGAHCNVLVAVGGGPMEAIQMAYLGAHLRMEAVGHRVGWDLGTSARAVSQEFGSIVFTSRSSLLDSQLPTNPLLYGYSHLIIHVHGDDWWSELLLVRLVGILRERPELRVILLVGEGEEVSSWLHSHLPSLNLIGMPRMVPNRYLLSDIREMVKVPEGDKVKLMHRLLAHLCLNTDPMDTIHIVMDGEWIHGLLTEMQADEMGMGWRDPDRYFFLVLHHGLNPEEISSLYPGDPLPAGVRRIVISPWWIECGAAYLLDSGEEVFDCVSQADRPWMLRARRPLTRGSFRDRSMLCLHYWCLTELDQLIMPDTNREWRSLSAKVHAPGWQDFPLTTGLASSSGALTACDRWLERIPLDPRVTKPLWQGLLLRYLGFSLPRLSQSFPAADQGWYQSAVEMCVKIHGHTHRLAQLFERGEQVFTENDPQGPLFASDSRLAQHLLMQDDKHDPILSKYREWLRDSLQWQSHFLLRESYTPNGSFAPHEMASFVDKLVRTCNTLITLEGK